MGVQDRWRSQPELLLVVLACAACTFLVGLGLGLCLPAPGRKPLPPATQVATTPAEPARPTPEATAQPTPEETPESVAPVEPAQPGGSVSSPVPLPVPSPGTKGEPRTSFPGWNNRPVPGAASPEEATPPPAESDEGAAEATTPPVAGPGEGRRSERQRAAEGDPGEAMTDGEG